MSSISIQLTETDVSFERKVLSACAEEFNRLLNKSVSKIKTDISNLIVEKVRNCPEVQSILNGQLQAELGFAKPELFVDSLLEAVSKDIHIVLTSVAVVGSNLTGGMVISIIKDDFSALLSMSKSVYNSYGSELPVPWLQWLLFEGGSIVIMDYEIQYGNFSSPIPSRTGKALMKRGKGYQIPPAYAGTKSNNFITRALDPSLEDSILNILQTYLS